MQKGRHRPDNCETKVDMRTREREDSPPSCCGRRAGSGRAVPRRDGFESLSHGALLGGDLVVEEDAVTDPRGSARHFPRRNKDRTYSSCSHGSASEGKETVNDYFEDSRKGEGRLTVDPDVGDVGAAKVADILRDLGALLLQLVVHCVRHGVTFSSVKRLPTVFDAV